MKTIIYVNPKGGAGKSTGAMFLANTLAYHYKYTVFLVSIDTQGTPPNLRADDIEQYGDSDDYYDVLATDSQYFKETILPDKENMEKDGLDFLIIDSPGYVDANTYLIAKQCDLVLLPVKLSGIDLKDFTKDTVPTIMESLFDDPKMEEKTFWYASEIDRRTAAYKDFISNKENYESIGIKITSGLLKREDFKYPETVNFFPDVLNEKGRIIKDNSEARNILKDYTNNILSLVNIKPNGTR